MMKRIKQTVRGCGYLPHCGEHPGTGVLFILVLGGAAVAGKAGGLGGVVLGAAVMLLVYGPLYLYGAYTRAVENDRMKERKKC